MMFALSNARSAGESFSVKIQAAKAGGLLSDGHFRKRDDSQPERCHCSGD
jgi:hypothetical protein